MKIKFFFVFLIFPIILKSQIISGNYSDVINLAYNPTDSTVSGYYEDYGGYDRETGEANFSCIFYFTGKCFNKEFNIISYYPGDESDSILGKIILVDSSNFKIKLNSDHGGCSNVQILSDEFVNFSLTKKANWIKIDYLKSDKAYFYSEKNENTKRKAFVLKNDILYIYKIEDDWCYCEYHGKRITKGWIKIKNL